MAVLKKHLTALGKGGKVIKHTGKGATEQRLPNSASGGFSSNMNDYAAATPLASPSADTPDNPLGP